VDGNGSFVTGLIVSKESPTATIPRRRRVKRDCPWRLPCGPSSVAAQGLARTSSSTRRSAYRASSELYVVRSEVGAILVAHRLSTTSRRITAYTKKTCAWPRPRVGPHGRRHGQSLSLAAAAEWVAVGTPSTRFTAVTKEHCRPPRISMALGHVVDLCDDALGEPRIGWIRSVPGISAGTTCRGLRRCVRVPAARHRRSQYADALGASTSYALGSPFAAGDGRHRGMMQANAGR